MANVSSFIEEYIEKHFGLKPHVSFVNTDPYITLIHLRDFLLPSEKILVNQGNAKRVMETRDFMIYSLKSEFLEHVGLLTDRHYSELYADWNLEKGTGMLLAVSDSGPKNETLTWPAEVDEDTVRQIFMINSIHTEKKPDSIQYFWLTDRYLLIERSGIMVDIEKELIKIGNEEQLRLAKRPMEYQILRLYNLNKALNKTVAELFVDWDFHKDKGYHVLVLDEV
ncbi:Na-translocating system protein MpsC family protein [Jeotgalibacillus sp. ET6]|uniref:Na-translocating system protein MpsC family protein n=1 Tax=Jeotgalibacillus sp. ET6 TaxID=3037260 RepID=UPI0024184194|nr:Na-translocating system protein MpsC family protein [Jeotgalibacillus sp. ET6]MDG5472023.1 Na-translocating system protein MpsC family protein [Jeotgalibacillus sp. ET6]